MTVKRGRLRFLPVPDAPCERWSRPERFDFLDRLPAAPVADTELLQLSHYCPIVIVLTDEGPRVVALFDPALLEWNPVGKDGRWRAPYAPMALRSLPFWPGLDSVNIEISMDLVEEGMEGGFALHDGTGKPSEEYKAVLTLIDRLQSGIPRLTDAAKALVAADLLTPLVVTSGVGETPEPTGYLTACPSRTASLPAQRAAALSMDRCLPLDLLTACLYSQRLLGRKVTPQKPQIDKRAEASEPQPQGPSNIEPLDLHAHVDDSPLFSFELFERSQASIHESA